VTTWIAFLRGINVGGRNILPMSELKALLEELGCTDVRTYIQSGNVVFRHEEGQAAGLSETISEAALSRFHFAPYVLLLTANYLENALAANPFSTAEEKPKTMHLYLLSATPSEPDLGGLEKLKLASEKFKLIDQVFYLFAPDGVGKSKLAARVEKLLGVAATARNWRTAQKMLELAK
jgi:uncharacterized protein (DUF1697 family)